MRSELAKAVKKQFEARLKRELPQFRPVTSAETPAGCRLFEWQVASELSTFLLLVISRDDRFTVEGAWSSDGQFPNRLLPGYPINFPAENVRRDEPKDGRFRFRLSRLWQPRGDPWWELVPQPSMAELQARLDRLAQGIIDDPPVEEALQKVEPLVDDAVRKVALHAVPYFLEIARSLGFNPGDLHGS